MSFSSLLSELKGKPITDNRTKLSGSSQHKSGTLKKKQVPASSSLDKIEQKKPGYRKSVPSITSSSHVDPAVARLKAARQKEKADLMLKKEKEKREKLIRMGIDPDEVDTSKRKKSSSNRSSSAGSDRPRAKPTATKRSTTNKNKYEDDYSSIVPKKKLKFAELMKQAEKIDVSSTINSGFSYEKQKKSSETNSKSTEPRINRTTNRNPANANRRNMREQRTQQRKPISSNRKDPATERSMKNNTRISRPSSTSSLTDSRSRMENRKPVGFRGPSEKLKKKLEAKKKMEKRSGYVDDYDDDDDDFIVHDEEQEDYDDRNDAGYDRNEIWNIFNRGKKARYYDYDDYDDESDMEATGDQVFDEEEYSNRQALLEERREKELEKEHYRQKQKRLNR